MTSQRNCINWNHNSIPDEKQLNSLQRLFQFHAIYGKFHHDAIAALSEMPFVDIAFGESDNGKSIQNQMDE